MKNCLNIMALAFLLATVAACKGDPVERVVEKTVVKEVPPQCEPCPPCETQAGTENAPEAEVAGPETTVLYHLVDDYEPVVFTHAAHVEYEEDCEVCHHHSSEVEHYPACRECHGKPSDHLRKPGLRGAYHRQCMNCHREQESGPLGCEECHAARTGEAANQEALARKYVHEVMKLGHLANEFGEVVFNHKLHVELTDRCEDCHHHHTDIEVTPPCRECHNKTVSAAGGEPLGLKDAYHQQCLGCHKTTSTQGKKDSPLKCTDCHLSRNEPESVELGHLAKKYAPVEFDHSSHSEALKFCTDCHHRNTKFEKIQACRVCHHPSPEADNGMALEEAYHRQCIDCHKKMDEGPQECSDCHEDYEE